MSDCPTIFVVDDDAAVRDSLSLLLASAGYMVKSYGDAASFLAEYAPGHVACLILDVQMSGVNGPELQAELRRCGYSLPIVFVTAHGDVPTSVQAMKLGAVDFLLKPVVAEELLQRVREALEKSKQAIEESSRVRAVHARLDTLTTREREIMSMVVQGLSSKDIARRLGISNRTVEKHRIRVMQKTGASNLIDLSRFADGAIFS